MQRNPFPITAGPRHVRGFTLIELLVVISIVAVMATLAFVGSARFIENGRKVQALGLFRDFESGLTLYTTEYNHPPLPNERRASGEDTVFSEPVKIKQYSNGLLVAALAGDASDLPYHTNYDISEINPRGESLITFKFNPEKKNGVGKDGIFYDPWGREIIVAVNAFKSTNPSDVLVDQNPNSPGTNDNHLETYKYGEYKETKPRDQPFVFWSYGKDGLKGSGNKVPTKIIGYGQTDDVKSW